MSSRRDAALAEIEAAAREVAASLGLEIVELAFHSQGKHSLLRIDIDRQGPAGVGLQDCEALSRALDARLEVIELFDAPYELQVSSPGLDRPIRSDDDLRRNEGRLVRAEYRDPSGKPMETAGVLLAVGPRGAVRVDDGKTVVEISRDRILLLKQSLMPKGRRPQDR
jgi:ribosome maturation factor RimP